MPKIIKRTRKQRLADRAAKAHARALERGDTPIGTRRGPSSPRTLSNTTVPVYRREQTLLDKISNDEIEVPVNYESNNGGWLRDLFSFERKTSDSQKRNRRQNRQRCRDRQGRRHWSCK